MQRQRGAAMAVHIFGDSHSHYLFSRVANVSVHWLGSYTMHRVARDGLVFLDGCGLTTDDVVVLVFGEIDIRCHLVPLAKHSGTTIEEMACNLADRYARSLTDAMSKRPGLRFAILEPPPPLHPLRENPEIPVRGSDADRVSARIALSRRLKEHALKSGFIFVTFPAVYENAQGMMRLIISDGAAHIAKDYTLAASVALSDAIGVPLEWTSSSLLARGLRSAGRSLAAILGDHRRMWNLGKI
jgi:hypothetical protein